MAGETDGEVEVPRLDEVAGYVSAAKAAEMLHVNDSRIRQLVGEGALAARRWGGKVLMIEKRSVEQVLASQQGDYRRRGPSRGNGGRPRTAHPSASGT